MSKQQDFSEEDIQKTIKYLKTKNPEEATRGNAIKFLKGMKVTAHMIANKVTEGTE